MDYMMPRADQFPRFDLHEVEGPPNSDDAINPLGIKAGGEAGTVPALAVMANAVTDALSVYGIEHVEMPFTSANIWAAIQAAERSAD